MPTTDEFAKLARAFNAMTTRLAHVETKRACLLKRILKAQEDERARTARELHDGMGQDLTSLLLGIRIAKNATHLDEAHERIEDLRSIAAGARTHVRSLAFEMHPSGLDDLGLAAVLERDARAYAEAHVLHVVCHVALPDGQRLPWDIEVTIYRIVTEAPSNMARHAKARNASVLVQRRGAVILAVVEDDGVGFDTATVLSSPPDRRFGLLSMEERARLLGGHVNFESSPGEGTTVVAEIPLPDDKANSEIEPNAYSHIDSG